MEGDRKSRVHFSSFILETNDWLNTFRTRLLGQPDWPLWWILVSRTISDDPRPCFSKQSRGTPVRRRGTKAHSDSRRVSSRLGTALLLLDGIIRNFIINRKLRDIEKEARINKFEKRFLSYGQVFNIKDIKTELEKMKTPSTEQLVSV